MGAAALVARLVCMRGNHKMFGHTIRVIAMEGFVVLLVLGWTVRLSTGRPRTLPQESAASLSAAYIAGLLVQADAAFENERYNEAADIYRQVFLIDPSNKHAASRLGWCHNDQKRYAEAVWPL